MVTIRHSGGVHEVRRTSLVGVAGVGHSGRIALDPNLVLPQVRVLGRSARRTMPLDHDSAESETIATLADGSAVGAWMLKANPAIWDIGAAVEQGLDVDWWRLAHSYRADLVRPGHWCVLWITKGDRRVASGIWGLGTISGEVIEAPGDPTDPLWVDERARNQVRPRVPVQMHILEVPITTEQVRSDPRLAGMEILRVPRIANPAAVSPSEWDVIRSLLS